MKTPLAALLLAAAVALTLAGCSFAEPIDDFDRLEPDRVEEIPAPPIPEPEPPAPRGWECRWDPTMNDDWHDDYVCSDGVSVDRPYLIPDDSFVERWEIDRAAALYEAQLNS